MKTQKLYKLVAKLNNRFCSISTLSVFLYYDLNKKTKPEIGKIFCFDTLENARDFNYGNNCTIVVGTGTNPSKIKKCCTRSRDIKLYWKLKKQHRTISHIEQSPAIKGTVLVDSFTPEEIIE